MNKEENDYIDSIVERIIKILFVNYKNENRSELWNWCLDHSSKIKIDRESLENMANSQLVWGFFGGTDPALNNIAIIKLAQAVGVCGIQNPENGLHLYPQNNVLGLTESQILKKIERKIGFKINLPVFIGNRNVSVTEYGIITERHCYYLWILKRIIELCPDRNTAIIEIGAGMGLLGYYLDKAGYKDYTVIDLAYTNACQTYFLARNLPDRKLILSGDYENPFDKLHKDSLKLLHATDFKNVEKNRFDLMINIDGLTEMKPDEANKYMQSDCAPLLLSINHEMNAYRINEINEPYRKLSYRYPFWLRDGYVEELYT